MLSSEQSAVPIVKRGRETAERENRTDGALPDGRTGRLVELSGLRMEDRNARVSFGAANSRGGVVRTGFALAFRVAHRPFREGHGLPVVANLISLASLTHLHLGSRSRSAPARLPFGSRSALPLGSRSAPG